MKKTYRNLELTANENGIAFRSLVTKDYPFVIINNNHMGFKVILADEVIDSLQYVIKNHSSLVLKKMSTYLIHKNENSFWSVTIPYKDKTVSPIDLIDCDSFDLQSDFESFPIPDCIENHPNAAIVTGFYE